MGILLLLVHIAVCVVLIMVVLLQSGKAADLAGAFGGGGSQTALGSRGAATFLTKATSTCAILFMLTSLGLALIGSKRDTSVLETLPAEVSSPAALPPSGGAGAGAGGAMAPPGDDAADAGAEAAAADGAGVEAPAEDGTDDAAAAGDGKTD
jgi:preprotein translocase subunit SecG